MDTFVQVFWKHESVCGINTLGNEINEYARERNLDIVSASPCFLGNIAMVYVVFRKKGK